ncbi:urease subunit gamma, partial [Streptomyces albidoflavus]|nr:urease subunit gamma [Streptomyces albidoflavus]
AAACGYLGAEAPGTEPAPPGTTPAPPGAPTPETDA